MASIEQNLTPIRTDSTTLKILDLGNMVGGPFAATVLGDLGAEVIKVENPKGGDFVRWGAGTNGYPLLWQTHGRNKRSVTLNLKHPEGRALMLRLVQWADALIENNRPGTMAKLGLSYEEVRAVNPRIVYLSVSGYGATGPYHNRPSYEWAADAFGGLTAGTGFIDRPPVIPHGQAIADHTAALFGAIGVLEAVRRRDAAGPAGEGAFVDVGLYEPIIRMSNTYIANYATSGVLMQREGSFPSGQTAPHLKYGYAYETSDGRYIATYTPTRPQFERLMDLIGKPEYKTDSRFASDSYRVGDAYNEVDRVLREWIAARSLAEALAALVEADQPAAPVNGPAEIMADPHVAARENMVTFTNPRGDQVTIPGVLPKIGEGDRIRAPAEELGASNEAVFTGVLKIGGDELQRLATDGVI